MICPNPDCKRIVSPYDEKCQHCGNPLKPEHPIKDYEKKAGQIVKDVEARAEDIKEQIRSGFKEPSSFSSSVKNLETQQDSYTPLGENKLKDLNIKIPEQTMTKGKETSFKSSGKIERVDLEIDIKFSSLNPQGENILNWSLINIGVPLIKRLKITNRSTSIHKLENIIIKMRLAMGYSDSWEKTIEGIWPQQSKQFENISIPIVKEKVRTVKEQEQCSLKVEIYSQGDIVHSESVEIQIEPYNQWYSHEDAPYSVAGFISPNSKAVIEVINNAGEYLQKICGISSLHGYQKMYDKNGRVDQERSDFMTMGMVNAIYLSFQWGLKINYINPPSSFEWPGQKIFLPDDILEMKRGTCLDLALFYAACIERIGLYPLIFFIPQHAFLGVWLRAEYHRDFHMMLREHMEKKKNVNKFEFKHWLNDMYKLAIKDKNILLLNSTTFTSGGDFSLCIEQGEDALAECIKQDKEWSVVDIESIRFMVKPMQVEAM